MRNEDLARQRRRAPGRGSSLAEEGAKAGRRSSRPQESAGGGQPAGQSPGHPVPDWGAPPSQGPVSVLGGAAPVRHTGRPLTCPSKPSVGPAAASHLPHLSRSPKAPSRLPRLTVAHTAPVTASRSQVLGENVCGLNGGEVGSGFTDEREMWGVKGASRGLRGARLQWGRPRAVTSRPPSSSPFHLSLLTRVHKRGCNSLSVLIDQGGHQ